MGDFHFRSGEADQGQGERRWKGWRGESAGKESGGPLIIYGGIAVGWYEGESDEIFSGYWFASYGAMYH